jgi:DNA-binding sugar fermentation-stimulating protein
LHGGGTFPEAPAGPGFLHVSAVVHLHLQGLRVIVCFLVSGGKSAKYSIAQSYSKEDI